MYTAVDHQFMSEALAQAQNALYLSNPNPRVGCVIVKEGQVIGRGFTQKVGGSHAEVQALADARAQGYDPAGATIYVTLEPCSHTGRTPPCVDALIAAKPAVVMVAMTDPNPLVSGKGIERLRTAGIDVRCGLLESEAKAINLGFISRMTRGLPWVRLKIAASLDGKTALSNGQSQWITGPLARADGHHWRAQACAILTGVGTIKEDDPALNVRDVPTERQPWRIIVDSQLETPLHAKILNHLDQSGVILVCASLESAHAQEKAKAFEELGAQVIAMANQNGKVDLPQLFAYLAQQYHMNEIHVEAGFKLNGSLLREECVDELLLYYAPFFMGEGIGMANISPLAQLNQRQNWQIFDHSLFGQDLRLRLSKKESN
ncbi:MULTISPECIES: bifunctional diaminohydroxyphosphoribosylaminopyrimidine deaminase/5-amino-6-(5-phosphoribosylamino)uracil reductase RibD [unclassified Polynucleobacter]|uniref:bifunctional diaminohydroxyphosphoribosylaminopyrimidine deaminase/5-amino-6-(5-phosphoribosylamino)uracil reductase RibD n=1 Tax=unclassified Polynucleobacter TaxID=2640945 RepID=UPI0008D83D0D|nr:MULTISPECIES: bifunctional diaminohydroxyphosphoribosylaminopyrimidine deaminase/5-amino-6-(5-phosphoribosylamino)uracil reductase RibD [unclassified Polynucleobacter]OHC09715.1 MAG: riboflavin biosynthesis protein RibD [Polynucleobacter sp. GWA2_45_21]HBK43816.1 bifunctional diaminohydroxyphosphoribosylaminopyrimidine deaminase/5-amino-6-(5-phosphoribosylamino)uracil reductase RibD [Polynucleobacter sp.]